MDQPVPTLPWYEVASDRLNQLVDPPKGCPWCYQAAGQPFPAGTTNEMCARHRQQVQQGVRR